MAQRAESGVAAGGISMTASGRPQLAYLHDALEELKAKGQHFRLRVLQGEQLPVANFDGKAGHQSQLE